MNAHIPVNLYIRFFSHQIHFSKSSNFTDFSHIIHVYYISFCVMIISLFTTLCDPSFCRGQYLRMRWIYTAYLAMKLNEDDWRTILFIIATCMNTSLDNYYLKIILIYENLLNLKEDSSKMMYITLTVSQSEITNQQTVYWQ